jgi:uncharacterized repeat protein (TIGR01451 family)
MTKNILSRASRALAVAFITVLVGGAAAYAGGVNQLARVLAATESRAAVTSAAAAQTTGRPLVKVVLSGTVERGEQKVSVEKTGPVKPGEVVSFTLDSANEGASAAHDYRSIGKIPSGTVFVEGSAHGDGSSQVSYSIDGGRTYAAQPMIEERQADGTTKMVPAPVTMYTQVRFQWAAPLAAGNKVSASYQVRVK